MNVAHGQSLDECFRYALLGQLRGVPDDHGQSAERSAGLDCARDRIEVHARSTIDDQAIRILRSYRFQHCGERFFRDDHVLAGYSVINRIDGAAAQFDHENALGRPPDCVKQVLQSVV